MKKLFFTLFILAASSVQAFSSPLNVVTVGAPAINCVFSPSCSITVSDTVTTIPLAVTGSASLQTRTFSGQSGSAAQGLYGYEYRIDLSRAVSAGSAQCVNSLKVNFGRVVNTLDYNGNGAPDDVFVITSGGLGNVTVSSADRDDAGNVTFTFNPPVCSGNIWTRGQSTFFFGLVSRQPSSSISAVVSATSGTTYQLAARAPLTPPDLTAWLQAHPNVANAIKWQYQPADWASVYTPPTEASKTAWPNWSQNQKADLNEAYSDTWEWFQKGAQQVSMDPAGLTDQPTNIDDHGFDNVTVGAGVTPDYMWKLYIAHVAFSLAVEINGKVPWSITGYDADSLRYLFDSTTMAWNFFQSEYAMGTYYVYVPALRADNRPQTEFGPPLWTFPFMTQTGLIGATRHETIGRVLDWMRQNMTHMYEPQTYAGYFAAWQYRGYAPISKIVNGTVDSNYQQGGVAHYTAGCHGSLGFMNQVLRVVNIPMQTVWICGHELGYFMSEKLYLDHGDDPYNANVRNSTMPSLSLLIDEPTYKSWFTGDLTINITDDQSPACANIGRRALEFQ